MEPPDLEEELRAEWAVGEADAASGRSSDAGSQAGGDGAEPECAGSASDGD